MSQHIRKGQSIHIVKDRCKSQRRQCAHRLPLGVSPCVSQPLTHYPLRREGPNLKGQVQSRGTLGTLGKTGESVKRVD